MKQAVRENRRGKVRVNCVLFDHAPEVSLLRSRMEVMEVCEEWHDPYTRFVWFVGYAPEFDVLELGQLPPEYEPIFTCYDAGPPLKLTFRRCAGEDRRIEEFKEASDVERINEWMRQIFEYASQACLTSGLRF